MFTYKAILEASENLGLDHLVRGKNIEANGRPVECLQEPADLEKINLSEQEREEVKSIGKLINNLVSQINFPHVYNLTTKEGKKEKERDVAIVKLIPIAKSAQQFWLDKGLAKSKPGIRKFTIHNGVVYEIDPTYEKRMDECNKRMEKIKRESNYKAAKSEQDASKVIYR